jgi:hypothetical protein
MEAWDRGPRWRENLAEGMKKLSPEWIEELRAAILEGCGHEDGLDDYGFPSSGKPRIGHRPKRRT